MGFQSTVSPEFVCGYRIFLPLWLSDNASFHLFSMQPFVPPEQLWHHASCLKCTRPWPLAFCCYGGSGHSLWPLRKEHVLRSLRAQGQDRISTWFPQFLVLEAKFKPSWVKYKPWIYQGQKPALPANVVGRCTSTTKILVWWRRILDGDDGGDAHWLVEVVPSEGVGQGVSCVSRGRGSTRKANPRS